MHSRSYDEYHTNNYRNKNKRDPECTGDIDQKAECKGHQERPDISQRRDEAHNAPRRLREALVFNRECERYGEYTYNGESREEEA